MLRTMSLLLQSALAVANHAYELWKKQRVELPQGRVSGEPDQAQLFQLHLDAVRAVSSKVSLSHRSKHLSESHDTVTEESAASTGWLDHGRPAPSF